MAVAGWNFPKYRVTDKNKLFCLYLWQNTKCISITQIYTSQDSRELAANTSHLKLCLSEESSSHIWTVPGHGRMCDARKT